MRADAGAPPSPTFSLSPQCPHRFQVCGPFHSLSYPLQSCRSLCLWRTMQIPTRRGEHPLRCASLMYLSVRSIDLGFFEIMHASCLPVMPLQQHARLTGKKPKDPMSSFDLPSPRCCRMRGRPSSPRPRYTPPKRPRLLLERRHHRSQQQQRRRVPRADMQQRKPRPLPLPLPTPPSTPQRAHPSPPPLGPQQGRQQHPPASRLTYP